MGTTKAILEAVSGRKRNVCTVYSSVRGWGSRTEPRKLEGKTFSKKMRLEWVWNVLGGDFSGFFWMLETFVVFLKTFDTAKGSFETFLGQKFV